MGALFKVFKSDGITEITNIKSVVFREAVNTGEHLTPGCVSSAEIEVEVFNTQANAVSAGDVVYAYVYDNANNGTLLGKFNCEPRIDTKNSYKFTAYDNALKLNADFSQWLQANQSNFPYTVKQLVQQACTIAGVTLGSSSWPLSSQSVQAFYADGLTCRDILSYAAELAGRFVRCHTDGNIYFDWYAASANSIAPSVGTGIYAYKQDGLTYANYTTTALARVAVHPSGEDDVAYIYPTGVTSGNTLHIKNNLLLTGADASFFNAAAQQVYTAVTAVGSYCPMSVNLFPRENPFRAGDIVSITDAQSVTISAPITEMTISNAAATLVSEGRETYEDTNETAKAITQLASDVVRINKLKVSWAEIDQAIINYLTANDVVAQNLTIVDANDVVLATFNANGITIGQSGESHMSLDFNSLELFDKDGNRYVYLGDLRDANGEATLTEKYETSSATTDLYTQFNISSIDSITVDGIATSAYTFNPNSNHIVFSPSIAANSEIIVTYKTTESAYRYDLGQRRSGTNIGAWSVANGVHSESSGNYSTVAGGHTNTSSGTYAFVGGGYYNEANGMASVSVGGYYNRANGDRSAVVSGQNNTASGSNSFIGGGQSNTASDYGASVNGGESNTAIGNYAFVGGGSSNTASGAWSDITGGRSNTASGDYSTIGGGHECSASGQYATACGGKQSKATGDSSTVVGGVWNIVKCKSQVAFGEYNDYENGTANTRGTYIELVGNGTSNNARSNARTLDWSGNETLAGGLTTGDSIVAQKSGDTYVEVQDTDTQCRLMMDSYTSGTHGLWSSGYYDGTNYHANGVWLIRRKPDNEVVVNGNCTGTAANVTGTVAIANGGTGATDADTARANLGLGGIRFFQTATPANSSIVITFPASSCMGAIFTSGASSAKRSMYLFGSTSSGTVGATRVFAGADVSTSESGNKLTISNTASGYLFINIMQWTGTSVTIS